MRDAVTTCKYVQSLSSYDLVSAANQNIIIRVPGEAGRLLVQLYFQAEHANTAVTHPEDDTPITPPGSIKKPKKPAPHIKPQPRAQIPLQGAFPGRPPYYGPQPTYGSSNGQWSLRTSDSSHDVIWRPEWLPDRMTRRLEPFQPTDTQMVLYSFDFKSHQRLREYLWTLHMFLCLNREICISFQRL